jgi:hypothetical protein
MNDWISVDDKLPPSQQMVLLHAPRNYNTAGGITFGWYDYAARGFMHQVAYGAAVIDDQMTAKVSERKWTGVTHWMHLPEPPK